MVVELHETRLPGVGVRYDFATDEGRRIGVITHHSGKRELLIYGEDDPDACEQALRLDDADSRALIELLGGSQVSSTLAQLQHKVEGLAIDWLGIHGDWAAAGQTITDTQLRRRTGVSIVAILRDGQTIPSPEPTQALDAGDTLVVVGTPQGIEAASVILRVG